MKKFSFYILIIGFLISCQQHDYKTIAVKGNIKNATTNKVVLISFGGNNNAIILDTCTIDKKGNYTLKSLSNDDELYAIKVGNEKEIWFVNDVNEITINADENNYKNYQTIGSTASQALHSFIGNLDSFTILQKSIQLNIDTLSQQKQKDSIINIAKQERKEIKKTIETYCTNAIINTQSPALKYFYLFYTHKTNAIEANEVNRLLQSACLQFPKHTQLFGFKNNFAEYVKENPKLFLINEAANNFNYVDIDSNKISLKTFAGKYLLIHFWQSKSKECNQFNESLSSIYAKHKNNNFEILGIAFDSSHLAWKKTIQKDSLIWKQVRDTNYYKSELAKKYEVKSVPYNVLINPTGKIIAVDIKEEELKEKLKDLGNWH